MIIRTTTTTVAELYYMTNNEVDGCYLEIVGKPVTFWISVFHCKHNISCRDESSFRHSFNTYR